MTPDEIKNAQRKFIEAAVRCKKAGYDGVELHGAHSYLIGQFFSPYYNKRTDEYGGSLENRMRFVSEIIDGIRAALGPNFPISVRISGDEMTPDVPGTLNLDDGLDIGAYLESKGIDALNVSNGSALNGNANCDPYSYKPGWKKHVAKAFKSRLSIPVIATNTVKDPYFAESLLEESVCDFVALGRSQFADPFFVRKARAGLAETIRPCIGCMFCRERLLVHGNSVACAVNARMGREYILGDLRRDGGGRPAAVVGGGPAGMETARMLAERGFKVTLFERADALGGTLNTAAIPPRKELIAKLSASMTKQLEALGVEVRLRTEGTPEAVGRLSPLGVFVASGAEPIVPDLPGMELEGVCTAEDAISGRADPSGRVVIVGTGLTGLEAADMLTERGASITLAEMMDDVGPGLFPVVKNDIMARIAKGKPAILTGHRLVSVEKNKNGLRVNMRRGADDVSVDADYAVLALGVRSNTLAAEALEASFGASRVFAIGSAARPGRIYEAIRDGYDAAHSFEPEP
jgi:thioredoxin reductase